MTKLSVALRIFSKVHYYNCFFYANYIEHKVFKNLTIKVKNLLFNGQTKEENLELKLGKKLVNSNKNIKEENCIC